MPTYVFKNKETGEIEEYVMSYTKLDEFKEQNPTLERHFEVADLPGFGDTMRMSINSGMKADGRFEREIIGRIKAKVPKNTLAKTHKTKMPREW